MARSFRTTRSFLVGLPLVAACAQSSTPEPKHQSPLAAIASEPAAQPAPGAAKNAVLAAMAADLIVTDVTIHGAPPAARAFAVRGARIAAVGSIDDVLRLKGPGTRVIEGKGRSVVVALTDAHTHLEKLGEGMSQVDLRGCTSPEACAQKVQAFAKAGKAPASGKGAWLRGRGWDQNLFASKVFPSRAPLDAIESERPVWLDRVDGHAGWANAAALKAAGITAATKDPPGGRIVRDAKRNPTGVLVDAAMTLVTRVIPPPSAVEVERAILAAQDHALARGLTEVHEMGLEEDVVAAYRKLATSHALKIRVTAYAAGSSPAAVKAALAKKPDAATEDSFFRLGGIKIYADGALGSRGAELLQPYADEPTQSGLALVDTNVLGDAAKGALTSGWQLAVHAIGDAANRKVLDAFAAAGCTPAKNHRFRIEHAQIVDGADVPRFASLGVIASMQPTHATSDMAWVPARLGDKRVQEAYAWRSILATGAHLVAGSDAPVEAIDPTSGFFAFVTRQSEKGDPKGGWTPTQRLHLDEALRAFTTEAAYAAFEDGWRGAPKEGLAADVTLFDRTFSETDASTLREAKVVLTLVGGAVAYENKNSL